MLKWINDLEIITKLIIVFVIVSLVTAFVGYTGINSLTGMNAKLQEMYEIHFEGVSHTKDATVNVVNMDRALRDYILARNQRERDEHFDTMTRINLAFRSEMEKTLNTLLTTEEKEIYERTMHEYEEYIRYRDLAIEEINRVGLSYMDDGMFKVIALEQENANKLYDLLNQLSKIEFKLFENAYRDSNELNSRSILLMRALVVLAVLFSVGFGLIISRLLSNPVKELAEQSSLIAEGDLRYYDTPVVEKLLESNNELGRLSRAYRDMVVNLRKMLSRLIEITSSIATAGTEISFSTQQMAADAQEQTSQAVEVASAVEEMTKTIIENAKNASATVEAAKQSKKIAEQGNNVVEDTLVGMQRIAAIVKRSEQTLQELGKSSEEIGEIISVIDDIADQTNLLALNAAIEAARAGEHGRGFAVVADEVRKLAERTAKSTKEIAVIIKTIQDDTKGAVQSIDDGNKVVDEGIQLADKAGETLQEIVMMSQKVTDMVEQIAAANEEQSSTSEQISKNVEAISSVSQQTASGTEQIARAADDLNKLTEQLAQLAGAFNISDQTESSPRQSSSRHNLPEKPSIEYSSKTSQYESNKVS